MAMVTVGELLDRVMDFESQLTAYYAAIRDGSSDNGVRLLTYYLARHGRRQRDAVSSVAPALWQGLRAMELDQDQSPGGADGLRLPDVAPAAVMGEALIDAAVQYDRELIALYRAILKQPLDGEVHAAVEALIRQEEGDIVMLKKMLAMHYF